MREKEFLDQHLASLMGMIENGGEQGERAKKALFREFPDIATSLVFEQNRAGRQVGKDSRFKKGKNRR